MREWAVLFPLLQCRPGQSRYVTIQKEQLSSPEQQAQTAGSIPKAFWERWFACPFPEAEEEDVHYPLGNTGSTGVPKALDPMG